MTKAERRIEELAEEIRRLRDEVRSLRPAPVYVPFYPPYVVPYWQPVQPVFVPTITQPTITWGDTSVGGGSCIGPVTSGFASVANLPAGTSFSYTVE